MSGCCVDKACTPETCMNLPKGITCANCAHLRRCVAMFGAKPENTFCDFFPRRLRVVAPVLL